MKRVAILTTSRAEFGILSPLIQELEKDNEISPLLFVGGAHLSEGYGNTINEIKDHGYKITGTFDYLLDETDSYSLSRGLSIAVDKLAYIFNAYDFDFVCIVGDRYESLSIVSNAILFKKPIVHIHGGESSEGAIDEQIRHMITKAAHLHFVSCEEHARNIRKMGEEEWRIFNTGALAIDSIVRLKRISKASIFKALGLDINKPTILLTYHPVTLENKVTPVEQIENIFQALDDFDLQIVITSPGADSNRNEILSFIEEEVRANDNLIYFNSLGIKKYHNLIPYCEFVIGNSSSGIIEVPFFKIPTINIGDRQKGRVRHASVIDTDYSKGAIKESIELALSSEFKDNIKELVFKFGNGHAAERISGILRDVSVDEPLMRKRLDFPEQENG